MRLRSSFIILGSFAAIAGGMYFMQKTQVQQEKVQTFAFNVDVQEKFVDNTKTWMIQDKTSKLVYIKFVFKNAGRAFEQKLGSLAVLEDVIFEGAGDLDAYHFQEFLANHQVGLSIATDRDDAFISIQTTPENLKHALHALTLIFKKLMLDADEFKRAKERILMNLEQSKLEPTSLASDNFGKYAFEKHPYFTSIDDMTKVVKEVKPEDVRNALKNHFTKDRMSCVLLGNFSLPVMENFIKDVKALLNDKSSLVDTLPVVAFKNSGTEKNFFMDVPQSIILFRMHGVPFTHPDFFALQVFNAVMGGNSFTARLWNEIRESRGLAYNINTGLAGDRYIEVLQGRMGTSTHQVKQALEILKKTMEETIEKGITQKELDSMKRFLTGDFVSSFDSLSQMGNILGNYITDRPLADLKERNAKIAALTLEEVNMAARKHLDYKNTTYCILGNHRD